MARLEKNYYTTSVTSLKRLFKLAWLCFAHSERDRKLKTVSVQTIVLMATRVDAKGPRLYVKNFN